MNSGTKMSAVAEVLQKLDNDKIKVLCERILTKGSKNFEDIFSTKERDKLIRSLGFSEDSLRMFVSGLYTLFVQTCYDKAFYPVEIYLKNNNVTHDRLETLKQAWTEHFTEFLIKVKQIPVGVSTSLYDFKWKLLIPEKTSELETAKIPPFGDVNLDIPPKLYSPDVKNPQVVMNFFTQNQSTGEKECSTVKIKKMEVQNLLDTFEQIQDRLDKMMA